MKFILALSALALLFALSAAQVSEDRFARRRGGSSSEDQVASYRVQLQGKIGASADKLDTNLEGWSTFILTPDNMELSHCSARLTPSQDQDVSLRNRKPQSEGKIMHAYNFYDKNAGTVRSFHVLKQDETDLGTCWAFEGDQNTAVIDDWAQAQEKCGDNQEGTVLTRRSTITDANGQQLISVFAVCKVQDDLKFISGEFTVAGKPVAVMEAQSVRALPKPDISDRATQLELSVPPACFLGSVRPFDIQDIMAEFHSQDSQEDQDSEDNQFGDRRAARRPLLKGMLLKNKIEGQDQDSEDSHVRGRLLKAKLLKNKIEENQDSEDSQLDDRSNVRGKILKGKLLKNKLEDRNQDSEDSQLDDRSDVRGKLLKGKLLKNKIEGLRE